MELLQSLVTVVLFVAILLTLIVVHELGHFLVARLLGIRVHEFGIGLPPRARVLRGGGETLVTLNWLPIGGFVKLEDELGESDDPRSFGRASLPKKVAVLAAGVVMNLALAYVIFAGIAWIPQPAYGLSFESVQAGSPAAGAGLAPGDLIVALDGRRFDRFEGEELLAAVRARAGTTVEIGIVRAGAVDPRPEAIRVALRAPAEIDAQHGALGIERLGFVESGVPLDRDPGGAAALGWTRTVEAMRTIADGLGGIVGAFLLRPTEAPAASGPVGIAVAVGEVFWQAGPLATLYLAALISANLALLNVVPFPPLDGGRILVVALKSVAGRRISLRAERLTYLLGFAFLFAFLIWVTVFDIARLGGAIQ